MYVKEPSVSSHAQVVLPIPNKGTFTYALPEPVQDWQLGQRVLAPFGHRTLTGYIVDFTPQTNLDFEVKPLLAKFEETPILTSELILLSKALAEFYGCSQGEIIFSLLPGGLIRQSRRTIVVTTQTAPEDLSEKERKILATIQTQKQNDFVQFIKKNKNSFSSLQALQKKGLIQIQTLLKSERAKTQKTSSYEANLKIQTPLKGKKQKEIFDWILSLPEKKVSAHELKTQFPNATSSVNDLIQKNVLIKTENFKKALRELDQTFIHAPAVKLNPNQSVATTEINKSLIDRSALSFLLFGATGSGKTEVYLQTAQKTLSLGKNVLALVPEIALTPQFVGRFKARFGETIAVLHSGLSDSERLTEWLRIRQGEAKFVIGARSAVFSPLENIGLIILDEEHDSSYKQEDGLLYHARHIAQLRARHHQATVVYGSATPDLQTFYQAQKGIFSQVNLPNRVENRPLPKVQIVDLRGELSKFGKKGLISKTLRDELEQTLIQKYQAVLFLNRRGFSPIVLCPKCGLGLQCPNCSVGLTFHHHKNTYECHYCNFIASRNQTCSQCKSASFVHLGFGTESVEQELRFLFPDATVARLDRDTTTQKNSHEKIIKDFMNQKIDILIGTQMVTKGLDVKTVNLVGVLLADQSLQFPDYRAAEVTFQLLTQVVGRAGRGEVPGKAIIQTFQPDHYSILCAQTQNFEAFYEKEIEFRRQLQYPPFHHLVLLRFSCQSEKSALDLSHWLSKQTQQLIDQKKLPITKLGPAPAPLRKIAGEHRFQMILKSKNKTQLHAFSTWLYQSALETFKKNEATLKLDLFPLKFL